MKAPHIAVGVVLLLTAGACAFPVYVPPASAKRANATDDQLAQQDEAKKKAADKEQKSGEICKVEPDAILPACRCVRSEAQAAGSVLPPPMPRRPD